MSDTNQSRLLDYWIIGLLGKSKTDDFHPSIYPLIQPPNFYAWLAGRN